MFGLEFVLIRWCIAQILKRTVTTLNRTKKIICYNSKPNKKIIRYYSKWNRRIIKRDLWSRAVNINLRSILGIPQRYLQRYLTLTNCINTFTENSQRNHQLFSENRTSVDVFLGFCSFYLNLQNVQKTVWLCRFSQRCKFCIFIKKL